MNKKTYKILRILFIIGIIVYIIFKSDILKEFNNLDANVSKTNSEVTKKVDIDGNLKVYFIDVGQADSILIENNNNYMLVDAGNNYDGALLVNYFKSIGINSFKYVIGTHPHEDHIGGMDDIINNFEIENYLMPDKISTSKTFEDVLDSLINKNMKYTVPNINDEYILGDANIKVIYIDSNSNNANDSSIVLKLTFGNNSFLLTGDASSVVEKKILDGDIESDVLKLGHHGSQYSTSNEFLDKVNPKYAVISVGDNNKYDHPKKVTLNKLDYRNIKLYRTDRDGTIIFTSDGTNINVETKKTDTNG